MEGKGRIVDSEVVCCHKMIYCTLGTLRRALCTVVQYDQNFRNGIVDIALGRSRGRRGQEQEGTNTVEISSISQLHSIEYFHSSTQRHFLITLQRHPPPCIFRYSGPYALVPPCVNTGGGRDIRAL